MRRRNGRGNKQSRSGQSTAMSADEAATTMVGERRIEELEVDIDGLLRAIHQVLKNNAIEVWQTYQQISIS
jgi:hypothetical protein